MMRIIHLMFCLHFVLMTLCVMTLSRDHDDHLIEHFESLYSSIIIREGDGLRWMSFREGPTYQSVIDFDRPNDLISPYIQSLAQIIKKRKINDTVLFVGLGGGSLPRWFYQNYPKADIQVIEIDPAVVDVAQKYFDFQLDPNCISTIDSKWHLRKQEKKHDLIVLDAYDTFYVPPHLCTLEFFRLCRQRLNPEGHLLINLWNPTTEMEKVLRRTLQSAFKTVLIQTVEDSQNKIISCNGLSSNLQHDILTDNFSPVEYLLQR